MVAGDEKKGVAKGKKGASQSTPEDIEAKINEIIIEGASGSQPARLESNPTFIIFKKDVIFGSSYLNVPSLFSWLEAGLKMEVDYADVTDKKVPEARALAAAGKLTEAIDVLMTLEKQTRTGGDMHSTSKILVGIVQMCYEVRLASDPLGNPSSRKIPEVMPH